MIYRYRTFGAHGQLTLLDDAVASEGTAQQASWSHETPYRFIEPNPIRSTHVPPGATLAAFLFGIIAIYGVIMALIALLGNIAQPGKTLAASLAAAAIGSVAVALIKRFSKVEWVMLPTTLNGHRIMLTRNGPDAEKYDEFVSALMERIENHDGS